MSLRRCVLALALGIAAGCEPPPQPGHAPGALAPEIFGKTVDGKEVKLSGFRGKVVLVNFWGTWCPPCRDQIPHEVEMMTVKYQGRPFTILGVAKDDRETLESFFRVHKLPWPNIVDGSGRISKDWDVQAFPSYLLVDAKGVIVRVWPNGARANTVWAEVEKAVKEAEGQ
ncbi:MAG TPA: TlpA disulfide reductase family protein [Gemmataceae bacterium]|jgi:peroxiredoxin|nr:TlpA disulfide reductase family protein [Gemmataceae bacterium]